MNITKNIDISRNNREVTTPGGIFLTFIPSLFKGERGKLIMFEKECSEKKMSEDLMVKQKEGKEKNIYFVIRKPKDGEDRFNLFTVSCGGGQDRREDYGFFKIKMLHQAMVVYDISSGWGDNHSALIAIREGGFVEIEGNHGAGFKSRNPQPDFLIRLKSDGKQENLSDLDVE